MSESPSCRLLSSLSASALSSFLDSFDTVVLDCDGVLWLGDQPIDGALDAVALFRRLGKRVFYCTNNSTKTRAEYLEKVSRLGFGGEEADIVATAHVAAKYLKAQGYDGKVFVLGSHAIAKELQNVGIEATGVGEDPLPDHWNLTMADDLLNELGPEYRCVVVGFDRKFNYIKVSKAASLLVRPDTLFIATNRDENFPHSGTNKIMLPGTAVMVNAVATASGREPVVMGKPSPLMFAEVQAANPDVRPERTLMVGDRANTDILMGKNCNMQGRTEGRGKTVARQTLLVGTGVHSLDDIREWETKPESANLVPDFYSDKLGDIATLLAKAGVNK